MSIYLNGFEVELSAKKFNVYVEEGSKNRDVKLLRDALEDEWFLHWHQGLLYGIPKVDCPRKSFGKAQMVSCDENLQLIRSRVGSLLPELFSKYEPLKQRPFTFLAQRRELVGEINAVIQGLPDIIQSFKIFPKYILEPKIFALYSNRAGIGLFLRLKTSWQIRASLTSLQNEGVELENLYVVRRYSSPGQRRLVGRIERLSQQTVYLSESFDELDFIDEDEVWLEGSKVSFSRCLKSILGNQYEKFEGSIPKVQKQSNCQGSIEIGTAKSQHGVDVFCLPLSP